MTGHVFVIQGDIRRFACDAYLYATDKDLRDGDGWTCSAPEASKRLDPAYEADFRAERRYTLPLLERPDRPSEPTTILAAVPFTGTQRAAQIVPRLEDFFRTADEISKRRPVTSRLESRTKRLLAVPLFGAAGGGGGHVRGHLLRVIDEQSRLAAERYDVDVAIVLRDPQAYALAQMIRRSGQEYWPELGEDLHHDAQRLGEIARDARLVPFMGAGTSVSAGAPSWKDLIRTLAREAHVPEDTIATLVDNHDVLDQAAYVRQQFTRSARSNPKVFAQAISRAVDKRRYGLLPPLLAGLTAEQAITLNYDHLFEWAAADGQRPRRVIPGTASQPEPWLLKLHGSIDSPDSIVLTRDDYLGFNSDRAALSSLVKATLMTRHLLFAGFGMSDPHFHEIVHDVRRAIPERSQPFGSVLTLGGSEVTERLWGDDLKFIKFDSGREIEIFVDAVLAYGATSNSYLLTPGYESVLEPADREVRDALLELRSSLTPQALTSKAWPAIERLLADLGDGTKAPNRVPNGLPEGLE